jgi:hypothetical protein
MTDHKRYRVRAWADWSNGQTFGGEFDGLDAALDAARRRPEGIVDLTECSCRAHNGRGILTNRRAVRHPAQSGQFVGTDLAVLA